MPGGLPPRVVKLLVLAVVSAAASSLNCDPECQNGDCVPFLGNLSCNCYENWFGEDCSTFVCNKENKCENGGTCTLNPNNRTQYICSCPVPFLGDHCQFIANGDSCVSDTCENGGSCYNLAAGGFQCLCPQGYWGVNCEHLVQNRSDPCQREGSCNGNGICSWDSNFHKGYFTCSCFPGYNKNFRCAHTDTTEYCPAGAANPCANNSTCEDILGYNDFGKPVYVDYQCTSCPEGFAGKNCSEPFDICEDRCGTGGCNATHGGHYYNCTCPPDRAGYDCDKYVDPCAADVCHSGGTCVQLAQRNLDGSYNGPGFTCDCFPGYGGTSCKVVTGESQTLCRPNPCLHQGQCHFSSNSSYTCECAAGLWGSNCEYTDYCSRDAPCGGNTERCENLPTGAVCICRKGWGGQNCGEDIDECLTSSTLCLNGGTCENSAGGFVCVCPPEYTGGKCEVYVPQPVNCSSSQPCLNGGKCVDQGAGKKVCNCTAGFTGDQCQRVACPHADCASLASNGKCDWKCFTEECGYDGREAFCYPSTTDPWMNCSKASYCRTRFRNGKCDRECNSRECFFDGNECQVTQECPVRGCANLTDNGVCDEECNIPRCPYDFQDCHSEQYARNILLLYILDRNPTSLPLMKNYTAQNELASVVGSLTQTNAIIISIIQLGPSDALQLNISIPLGAVLYRVNLHLDVEYCEEQCLKSAEEAVLLLEAVYSHGNTSLGRFEYARASTESDKKEGSKPNTTTPIAIVVTVVVVAVLGLFIAATVIVGKKRKITAKIWHPSQSQPEPDVVRSSPPAKKRRSNHTDSGTSTLVASGETSTMTASASSGDYIEKGSEAAKMSSAKGQIQWNNLVLPVGACSGTDAQETAIVGQIGTDSRKWNILHYSAVRNPETMRQLLETYKSKTGGPKSDLNTAGPGGYTPLMLAVTQPSSSGGGPRGARSLREPSRSSSSSESSGETNEQNTLLSPTSQPGGVWSDSTSPALSAATDTQFPLDCSVESLLASRVKIDATNDYGRTALHLAAVCARGDYVKKLLATGANPNIQDNWGQSPLHAAIGAAAEGAFHILISYTKTDINLKSDGGITPLMEAVKFVNIYTVKQLIKKNADISTADYEGRTAVHWAANVEFLPALKLLIRQGPDTIKDVQDNKGQTALFLACREGSEEVVKHLLDVFANATLLDNLDRSPMHIAFERQHMAIVEMLKSHGPYHYQLPPNTRMPVGHSARLQMPLHHPEMTLHHQQHQRPTVHMEQQYPPVGMMMEMQSMPPESYNPAAGYHQPRQNHHSPEMVSTATPHGQTFGDLGYPPHHSVMNNSSNMVQMQRQQQRQQQEQYSKPLTAPIYLSNPISSSAPLTSARTHLSAGQPYLSTSQLPPSTELSSPPITYTQHSSTSTQALHPPQQPPRLASDVSIMTYEQLPPAFSDASFPTYPTTSDYPTSTTMSQTEQMMVNDLITSMAEDVPPHSTSNSFASPPVAVGNTRPLQHLSEPTLPAYGCSATPAPDAYTTTSAQTQQQIYSPPQPHSASSVNSNRSPSTLYPSPPNSDTLQYSDLPQQTGQTVVYGHGASPPSLTPSPETREDGHRNSIATIEGLVQQHDYPNLFNYGVDSFNYSSGIRLAQDSYNNETTV